MTENGFLSITVRKYGCPPFRVAVLHGGPGAPGYMAPVARELAKMAGILEPLQTEDSLPGQLDELRKQLLDHAEPPVTLIGSSWGGVLALFVAAKYTELVGKLILIGSAVFDAASSARIGATRLARLTAEQRLRHETITRELERASGTERQHLFDEWGEILFAADVFDPLTRDLEVLEAQSELHQKVWSDFLVLRDQPGYLRREFSKIKTPTIVIHGEYDPHPIEGIRPFLEECLGDVTFYMLPACGHYPWIERQARERFFAILRDAI